MELGQRKPEYFRNAFEEGVFEAAYASPPQCQRRRLALLALSLKHGVRGLLFSWPAYLLALAIAYSGAFHALAFLVLLLPAVTLSIHLLIKGVRDDYHAHIENVLLKESFLKQILWR